MLTGLRNESRPLYRPATFWADLKAGTTLTASFVPTSIALGIISGMGPLAGLWCGIVVGIIAALLGGTRALVCGPSAAMAVITATLIAGNDFTLAEFSVVVVMAAAMQIAIGLTGIGRFLSYIPHVVLTGFMSGIGALVAWTQAYKLLHLSAADIALAAFCLVLFGVWPARAGKYVPAAVAALAFGWVASLFIPGITDLGPVPAGLPVPALEAPALEFLKGAIGPAALLALISSVYTLMWALTADTFTGSLHNPNRELLGLGIGNLVAGVVGAMPGSAAVSTATAHRFGGKTVVSSIVCQTIIAALVLGLGHYVSTIPVAAVYAIVIFVGWKLIDLPFLGKIWRNAVSSGRSRMDWHYATVMVLTMCLTIFVDPVLAIVFGTIAATIVNTARLETLELDSVVSTPLLDTIFDPEASAFDARVGLLSFRGAFTVSSARKLIRLMSEDIRDHDVVIIDLLDTTHFDDSAANLLATLIDRAKQTGTEIVVCGMGESSSGILFSFGVLDRIPKERFAETQKEARELAWSLL